MSDQRDKRPSSESDDLPGERRYRRDAEDPYMAVRSSAQEAIRRANSRDQGKGSDAVTSAIKKPGVVIAVVVGIAAVLAFAAYILVSRSTQPATTSPAPQTQPQTQTKQTPTFVRTTSRFGKRFADTRNVRYRANFDCSGRRKPADHRGKDNA